MNPMMNTDSQRRDVPQRLLDTHRTWTRQVKILQTVHVILVVTATSASILAASGVGKEWSETVENPLSVVAAIAIGLVSSFELGDKANGFRRGWRTLNAAIMRFEDEPSYSMNELMDKYEEAETLIGDTKASPKA